MTRGHWAGDPEKTHQNSHPEQQGSRNLFLGLIHHPIRDRLGEVVAGSVYTPDLHDLSRTARTFDLGGVFVTHPVESQRAMCERIVRHWREGYGATINPNRGEALDLTRIVPDVSAILREVTQRTGRQPLVVTTTARETPHAIGLERVRGWLVSHQPVVLLFGTGWGMTDGFLMSFDGVLAPIKGLGPYNHLSVRAAVAIIVDRLLGR